MLTHGLLRKGQIRKAGEVVSKTEGFLEKGCAAYAFRISRLARLLVEHASTGREHDGICRRLIEAAAGCEIKHPLAVRHLRAAIDRSLARLAPRGRGGEILALFETAVFLPLEMEGGEEDPPRQDGRGRFPGPGRRHGGELFEFSRPGPRGG
ncbi:MAG: hypothetical protein LBR53_10300 [Deltaproteobacteria bacterium]|nr:hypothetical protein [Deltaproteobacteria bacterium]